MGHSNFRREISNRCTLFFVHKDGYYIPVAHCLLQNKAKKTYKSVLQIPRDECCGLGFQLNPAKVMLDLEEAMISAVGEIFPFCTITGCRFHLGQSWFRKIKSLGLAPEYKNAGSKEGNLLRGIFGLALLPPEITRRVFVSYKRTLCGPSQKLR